MNYQSWLKQTWTIAKIEMRRAFFSKRAFWVYGLALFPSIIFFGNSLHMKFRRASLSAHGLTKPALMDGIKSGESEEAILQRLGKPASDFQWQNSRHIRDKSDSDGITVHKIEPAGEARYVRLNIIANNYLNDPFARIYEFEVYGDGPANLALRRPATSSPPCNPDEGPEKALNGSVAGGKKDRWCSSGWQRYMQVDLGNVFPIKRIVIKHAGAGGEKAELNTAMFSVQASRDNQTFTTIVNGTGARLVDEITSHRRIGYFDGEREARLSFENGKLASVKINPLLNFSEDREIFAGVFQFFYLRLAIFFGCLGIFMNLFRGEMLDKTLHFWFLAPARREVLLAGKYSAGLIASTAIFAGGALLCFALMLWTHNPVEVQAYWHSAGIGHAFWYAVASVLGCIGYGSVFLAAGLLMRNPIIPAALILGWEGINGFLPEILQKASVLYYLQSLCPVPAPIEKDMPAILRLLLVPAEPASRIGAILGLLAVTIVVLWIARLAILRMQVTYSTET
ncbi:MAG: discoidin domain-containing protein [Acidobacteria bacterium]|nr:discoidin domain-containing protein [Acidobacteriota bacterium]